MYQTSISHKENALPSNWVSHRLHSKVFHFRKEMVAPNQPQVNFRSVLQQEQGNGTIILPDDRMRFWWNEFSRRIIFRISLTIQFRSMQQRGTRNSNATFSYVFCHCCRIWAKKEIIIISIVSKQILFSTGVLEKIGSKFNSLSNIEFAISIREKKYLLTSLLAMTIILLH